MNSKLARRLLLVLGFLCGFGIVSAAAMVILSQNSGAGWQKRHRLSGGDLGQ